MTFLQSLDRHILRNFIFIEAISQDLPIPIGSQEVALLDTRIYDEDVEDEEGEIEIEALLSPTETEYRRRAAQVYQDYATRYQRRFKWIRPQLFQPELKKDLYSDAMALIGLLEACGTWEADRDCKLQQLIKLLSDIHPQEKVLIFTQFADTVRYLTTELKQRGFDIEGVTGESDDPAAIAWRFSPLSNQKNIASEDELRVLVATDVMSEGLNLQDCAIIVNYDLPWAIIRLIQRAGRIDRIGQTAEKILCYSFLPSEGVERVIRLRMRLRQRLRENAEVVGTDEAFFEDDTDDRIVLDLYHEKAGILDGDEDTEVDLTSEAYQIWKNAIDADPSLKKTIETLPNVVYSTRQHTPTSSYPEGVMLYMKTAEGNDSLAWVDKDGNSVTQSQISILRMAACYPDTKAIPRHPQHHDLVQQGVELIIEEETSGGQLGRPSGAKFRTYERLKRYTQEVQGTLFATSDLLKAIDQVYHYPLRQSAIDRLNRSLRSEISDRELAELVVALYLDDRLCIVHEDGSIQEPRIICSLGLFQEDF